MEGKQRYQNVCLLRHFPGADIFCSPSYCLGEILMTNFLVKHFVRNYQNTEDLEVRTAYGILAGVVGIICNLFLFAVKFISGSLLHSVAVTADAFNNFSDAGSSIISLVGVKMAEKPADRDHPFGHGRIEYIAALIVAFLVLDVGFGFFKVPLKKFCHPKS